MRADAYTHAGFRHEFFQPYVPPNRPITDAAARVSGPGATRTFYSADRHSSHDEFCRGPDFDQYKAEVRGDLDLLVDFCRRNQMPDVDQIAQGYEIFFCHRFVVALYFGEQEELVDSAGKLSLDRFCEMVSDDRIPLEKRKAAVRNLALGVTLCADGAVSNLICAERELAITVGGLRSKIWETKESVARAVLQQALSQKFGRERVYAVNEVHYVNLVWNVIAREFGLDAIPDATVPPLESCYVTACRNKVRVALTPDRLAGEIAQECLEWFGSRFATEPADQYRALTPGVLEQFEETLDEIRDSVGLQRHELGLNGFVRTEGQTFALCQDPSLIAVQLLRAMDALGILDGRPVNQGEWTDESRIRTGVFTYGDTLAWCAYTPGQPFGDTAWEQHIDIDLLTVPDLVRWNSVRDLDFGIEHTQLLVRQAIGASDVAQLCPMPVQWLVDGKTALRFLQRLGPAHAGAYLQDNVDYFLKAGPLPELTDHMMGVGDAALTLAEHWYADILTLLTSLRDARGTTRLQLWMEQGNAAAIRAVARGAFSARFLKVDQENRGQKIFQALRGRADAPMLYQAIKLGHTDAILAWRDLLGLFWQWKEVRPLMPWLLNDGEGACISALLDAVAQGHTATIRAFHLTLTDSRMGWQIAQGFPPLLSTGMAAHKARGLTPTPATDDGTMGWKLWQALEKGHPDAIRAFQSLLTHRIVDTKIGHVLARLLFAPDAAGKPALWHALASGNAKAIRGLHSFLGESNIVSQVKESLPQLLLAKDSAERPGLALALARNHAAAIDAFSALVCDPLITPHIAHVLPELLSARGGPELPGLYSAMAEGHADAIHAYRALLCNPAITPHLTTNVPAILEASDSLGASALSAAARCGKADGVHAFHAVLVDPAITPLVTQALPRLLSSNFKFRAPLLIALVHQSAEVIRALHTIIVDPRIYPHVVHALPDLLCVCNWDPLLLWNRVKTNGGAHIRALHALLADPKITPSIKNDLPKLFSTETVEHVLGSRGEGDSGLAKIILALMNDPAIAPHIGTLMPASTHHPL